MKLRNLFIAAFAAVGLFSSCEDKSGLGALAIELSDYELELKAAGEEKSIKVSASEDWFAEVDWKGAEAWLDISPAEGKAGENQAVVITATDNSNGYNRSIDVKFSIGVKSKWLKVKQLGGRGELVKEYTQISKIREKTPAASDATITLGDNLLVKGTVISNAELDNFTSGKTCYVQDETGGLQIFFGENHPFAFGDVVEIDLSGATLMNYKGSSEISGLPLDKAYKTGTATVTAKVVSMADFLANKYEGQYVEIDTPVQVSESDLSKTWVVGGAHTNINMEDADGNKFLVRSGKYSSFGAQTVAQGSGKIKGIASVYNSDIQLVFAQTSDYAGLTGARFVKEVVAASAEGLVVAVSEKSYLIKTADGYAYVFVGSDGSHTLKVGDQVTVDGEADVYNGVPQIINPTATVASSDNTVTHPTPVVLDAAAMDAYNAETGLFGYVTVTGNYSVSSGKYHNLAVAGASRTGSIVYPSDIPSEYQGMNLDVTGYFVGISGSVYFNIIVTDIKVSDEQPEAPEGIACDMIDKIANLTAGTYYMAGYLEEYKGTSGTTTFRPYSYQVWTGTLEKSGDDSDGVTISCSYSEGMMTPKLGTVQLPADVELVAVTDKNNTYYVKVGDKYLYSTESAVNRKLALGDTQAEWVATDNPKGGISLSTNSVWLGTGSAASKIIRTYNAESKVSHGLVFFKKK